MTVKEARQIEREFYDKSIPSEEDIFLYTEAMDVLISEENNPKDMLNLGGWYYEQKDFDLALKYYEMAAAFDIDQADVCLGYIWYYGRTGERDFEKAFHYYSKSMERGNLVSTYKVADMYKNGHYVEKNYEKYKAMIEDLYPRVKKSHRLNDPVPEIFTRLAAIRKEEGYPGAAVDLYLKAKDFLAQRIKYDPFFGNLNIMKWLIDDLYDIIEFFPDYVDFYDLYYVLKRPAKVTFNYNFRTYHLESAAEEGACAVHFQDKWFRDRDEFFKKAAIDGRRLTELYDCLYVFEVTMDGDH